MRTRLRVLGVTVATAAAAVAVPLVTSSQAHAARFTGGDVVVYRVGSGASALTNAATPVFLDEYGPTGTKLQSVALPTSASEGNQPLTAAGESQSEGLIDRSADGRFLVVTGYDAAPGTTGPGGISLTGSDPASVGRTIGLVDANGTVDTTTVLKGAGTAQIIRSATATNGERLWAAGGNGGVVTTTRGSSSASTVAGGATSNLSSLTVQGGRLFASGILTDRLAAVGSAAPPTSGSFADLTGLPSNLLTYGYAFLDETSASYNGTGLDTLYLADASSRGGTLDKFRWTGSTWSAAGSIDVPGVSGVVADKNGAAVSLAVTTPTSLLSVTDPNGAATSFAAGAPTVLATAPTNTEFRGVALAPTSAAGPSVFIRNPGVGATVPLGGKVTISAYVDSPNGVASVQAKIGSGSFVSATRSGHLWTASVPTTGLSAGKSTVTVKATDQAGTPATTTETRSVTLSGSSVPPGNLGAGTYPWTVSQVKVTGTWKTYLTSHSPSGKGRTSSTKKSTAATKVYGHGLVLTFDRTKTGGKATVTVDGKSTTVDLFSSTGKPLSKTWTFSGSLKSHAVVVTVLGTKDAASKGTAVFLAALKVQS